MAVALSPRPLIFQCCTFAVCWKRAASNKTAFVFKNQAEIFEDVKQIRESDKNFQPSKLLMVYRDKKLVGIPYWEKRIISEFGLDAKVFEAVVVKNTPSICKKLQRVKHLIRVKSLTFPQGVPKEGDWVGTLLKQDGQFVYLPHVTTVSPEHLKEDESRKRLALDNKTVGMELYRHWHT